MIKEENNKPMYEESILLLPDKSDVEINAVESEWQNAGGQVLRLESFWKPPAINGKDIKFYPIFQLLSLQPNKINCTF